MPQDFIYVLILCPSPPTTAADGATCDWVRSSGGQSADDSGQSPLALLPMEQEVVLVVPPHALSWHRVSVPKVPAKRLRAVLEGLLEEQLLADVATLHFALEPGARSGQTIWVCVSDRAWLRQRLDQLEVAQRPATRIVPAAWPGIGEGEVIHHAFDAGERAWLASATPDGVSLLPLDPASPMTGMPPVATEGATQARWLADPAVLSQAESCLHQRFEPVPVAQHLLRCAAGPWNLAQFELSLSSSARWGQRVRQQARDFVYAPAWRAARWGLMTLLIAGLGGLNTSAWLTQRHIDQQTGAVDRLLRETFPHVSVVLDAPVQMSQEVQRLRTASGSLGPRDLEVLLATVGRSLPPGAGTPTRVGYDGQSLLLSGWPDAGAPLEALKQALQDQGLNARVDGAELRVEPARK